MRNFLMLFAALALFSSASRAAEPGETRCGATGTVERYDCFGTSCRWANTYQRCANNNTAPNCNRGDTKCGADGRVQRCLDIGTGAGLSWQPGIERCAVDRDPADNAPPGYRGYGQQPYSAPTYNTTPSYGSSEPRVCSPGQQECGDDRQIRRCVMQGGRTAWETVAGSRCGGGAPGMRN